MSRNIASTKCRKIGGLRNYQRGENLKKGEVNFKRGGSDPLGNYDDTRVGARLCDLEGRNYQSGGNLKKGEVNFEKRGSRPTRKLWGDQLKANYSSRTY
jgi:hypothetical protein